MHDIQFGITDRFTLRAGALLLLPFHCIATYSFPINNKSTIAVGNLFIFLIDDFYGNLTYGIYTHGAEENNLSIGAGFWSPNIFQIGKVNNSPAFNLAGQYKISDHAYFTSENYIFNMYTQHTAYIGDEDNDNEGGYHTSDGVFFGLSGIKVKSRKNEMKSWQFSLLYIFVKEGKSPDKFRHPPWEGVNEGKITFIPIPMISYSKKFGKNY